MSSTLKQLQQADERAQFRFYDEHKSSFLFFARRFDLPREELLEVYQDACLVIFENAVLGKLDAIQSSLKTYLFGVAKFLIYKRFREIKTREEVDTAEITDNHYFEPFEEEINPRVVQIQRALQKMGKKCRKILTQFYFEQKDLDAIMRDSDYDSKDVLKSQKSRCLRQLKELIQTTDE